MSKQPNTQVSYKWRDGAHVRVDAAVAGPELERLTASGCTTAEEVLSEAKKKGSPLHEAFEWNDTKAGHQHRLQQARQMLRSIVRVVVRITPNGKTTETSRVVVGLKAAEPSRRYVRPEDMSSAERDAFARQLIGELRTFAERNAEFRGHALLREVFKAINNIPT